MSSIITQIEFAKLTGASKQAVYKAIRAGKIKTSKVKKKKQIVFDDPITKLWYEMQVAKNIKAPLQGKPTEKESKIGLETNLIDLQRQKLIEEIGKTKADKRLKELQYTQKRDILIPKDTVAAVLFQYIDALNINMLDLPDMIIDNVIDKVSAGKSRGNIIKFMRDMIRKSIVNTKKQIKERLK